MSTTAPTDDVTRELDAWLSQHWDPDLTVGEWWERLGTSGWAAPTWPTEWFGRGLSRDDANRVARTLARHGALGPPAGLGMLLAGPTIVAHGSDAQKQRWLRDIVTGQRAWCQLFSEPGAGSDLAGLQCRAVRDGDEWVVDGQKVWTSGGHYADLGMLLACTDLDVPKHKGISYFAIEMAQPGIDVRPLREMTGRSLFNEVFLTEARVPDDALIGDTGNGWAVANTTLAFERTGLGAGGGSGAVSAALAGTRAGHLERRAGDFVGDRPGAGNPASVRGRSSAFLVSLARDLGAAHDPLIRQDLVRLHTMNEIARFTNLRLKAAKESGSAMPPGAANTAKLAMSRITALSRDLGLRIVGAGGMLCGRDAPAESVPADLALFSPAVSIYGGSDQIQRNIIGERVLGLPGEPRVDKDLPFRELPSN